MAGFIYFLSGTEKSLDHAAIERLGLAYAFEAGCSIQCRESAGESPLGGGGLYFGDEQRLADRLPGYYPDNQEWRELPTVEGRPRMAIGYWTDAKPTPQELQRSSLLNGLTITLADEQKYQVPSVRCYDEQSQVWRSELPAYLDYDAAGNVVRGKPIEQYASLWDITADIGSELFEAEQENRDHSLTDQQLVDAAIALLGANYVVSLPELIMLKALADNGSLALVITAACRKAKLMEWIDTLQKKTESPSEPTG